MANHLTMNCPSCGKELRVREEYEGRRVGCNACGHEFLIQIQSGRTEDPPTDSTNGDLEVGHLEELWEREVASPRAEVVSPPARSSVKRPLPIDDEPSSMLIPVRKEEGCAPDIWETIADGDPFAPEPPSGEAMDPDYLRKENARLRAELDAMRDEVRALKVQHRKP